MTIDGALFWDDDQPPSADRAALAVDRIADWQMERLRRALDATGTHDMLARQELVEQLVGRPVSSLRELQSSEARVILEQLQSRAGSPRPRKLGSSWDDRDEQTWIDRL